MILISTLQSSVLEAAALDYKDLKVGQVNCDRPTDSGRRQSSTVLFVQYYTLLTLMCQFQLQTFISKVIKGMVIAVKEFGVLLSLSGVGNSCCDVIPASSGLACLFISVVSPSSCSLSLFPALYPLFIPSVLPKPHEAAAILLFRSNP